MSVSERYFMQGMAALAESRFAVAAEQFRSAICEARTASPAGPEPRYLSYYGLSLAMSDACSIDAAIDACEIAVERDPFKPALLLNLGRVYAKARRLTPALACLQRGINLSPDSRVIRRELERLDRRARPLVRGLDRCHPVNRLAGRLRTSLGWRKRTAA